MCRVQTAFSNLAAAAVQNAAASFSSIQHAGVLLTAITASESGVFSHSLWIKRRRAIRFSQDQVRSAHHLQSKGKSKSPIQSLVLTNLGKNGIHGFAHNFICSPPDAEELCVVNNCFDIYLTFLIIEYCKQIYYYKCNGKNSETGRTFF